MTLALKLLEIWIKPLLNYIHMGGTGEPIKLDNNRLECDQKYVLVGNECTVGMCETWVIR